MAAEIPVSDGMYANLANNFSVISKQASQNFRISVGQAKVRVDASHRGPNWQPRAIGLLILAELELWSQRRQNPSWQTKSAQHW